MNTIMKDVKSLFYFGLVLGFLSGCLWCLILLAVINPSFEGSYIIACILGITAMIITIIYQTLG